MPEGKSEATAFNFMRRHRSLKLNYMITNLYRLQMLHGLLFLVSSRLIKVVAAITVRLSFVCTAFLMTTPLFDLGSRHGVLRSV